MTLPDQSPQPDEGDTAPIPAVSDTAAGPPSGPTQFTSVRTDAYRDANGHMPGAHELGLIRRQQPVPQHGWRKLVHRISGGTVNPGESLEDRHVRRLSVRSNQPVDGAHSVAVLSLKGGVGKTTTTVGLGATLASLRGDRVVAVDANPDFGTLAQRGPGESRSTVRDLLADREIFRYSDVRKHTSQSSSRLEILASERDPAISEAFSEADYRAVHDVLDRYYNIVLTDCGTGLTHSAMAGVLNQADALVLVASPAVDSARSALATLDWLDHHGYRHLVPETTVVISSARPGPMPVDIDQLARHFLARVRALFVIPYDDHLAEGAEISLDLMSRRTRQAFMELAASIADGFQRPGAAMH